MTQGVASAPPRGLVVKATAGADAPERCAQAFTVAAYSLSPVFLMRAMNALPGVSPWATWGVGAVLAAMVLYHGWPRVMLPDPPHAFGLYLMSVLLLWIVTGLACFLTVWYLAGKFTRLDALIARLAELLPF